MKLTARPVIKLEAVLSFSVPVPEFEMASASVEDANVLAGCCFSLFFLSFSIQPEAISFAPADIDAAKLSFNVGLLLEPEPSLLVLLLLLLMFRWLYSIVT